MLIWENLCLKACICCQKIFYFLNKTSLKLFNFFTRCGSGLLNIDYQTCLTSDEGFSVCEVHRVYQVKHVCGRTQSNQS